MRYLMAHAAADDRRARRTRHRQAVRVLDNVIVAFGARLGVEPRARRRRVRWRRAGRRIRRAGRRRRDHRLVVAVRLRRIAGPVVVVLVIRTDAGGRVLLLHLLVEREQRLMFLLRRRRDLDRFLLDAAHAGRVGRRRRRCYRTDAVLLGRDQLTLGGRQIVWQLNLVVRVVGDDRAGIRDTQMLLVARSRAMCTWRRTRPMVNVMVSVP